MKLVKCTECETLVRQSALANDGRLEPGVLACECYAWDVRGRPADSMVYQMPDIWEVKKRENL